MRAAAIAAALVLAWAAAALALTFPDLTGRVVDEAGLLDAGDEAAIAANLQRLEEKTTDQLIVVTLESLQGTSIEDYGYQLGRHWGIGQQGKDNGALLIVAPNERSVRIEVGYGLEGTLTDAVTRVIIETAVLPRFRAGDFAGGIRDGAAAVVEVLGGDAGEWQQRAERQPSPDYGQAVVPFAMIVFIVLIWILVMRRAFNAGDDPDMPATGRRRHRGSGRRIGWFGGGRSSGGFGGGGFSGGGGSFGGGGSSGRW